MFEQTAQNLRDTELRIGHQLTRIRQLELAGRLSDARHARETLAAITETRDALLLRLKVVDQVTTTEAKWASLVRSISAVGQQRRAVRKLDSFQLRCSTFYSLDNICHDERLI